MNPVVAPFAPILVLSLGGLGYLLCGSWLERFRATSVLAVAILVAAICATIALPDSTAAVSHGVLVNAGTRLFALVACVSALVSIIATSSTLQREKIVMLSEYYYLLITSLCGVLVMIFASDFLTLFIGVEVASLALYCLCGAQVTERRSSEASMKYFLLGCFSSAFLLYGIAIWYGCTGTLSMVSPTAAAANSPSMLALSFLMIFVGVGFKIGLAPFHFWVPDVYQGSPTSVTTFMSCVVKVAAIAALIKVSASSFGFSEIWAVGPLWIVSVLAMTFGNLAALQQRSVKRLLAYSSVAQGGYMMMGLVAAGTSSTAVSATIFYMISYCAMTIGAFGVLGVIGPDADDIDALRGLGKRSPFLAAVMTILVLALAGLPPGLAGLIGKVYLFSEALNAHFYGLAVIAALNSALACAYYFRIPMAIYFLEANDPASIKVPVTAFIALSLCAACAIVFGVTPEPILQAVGDAVASMAPAR
jgi:NADH-quinone oxidoreductase subunit N